MADESKSFSDLLSEAPLASAEDTVSLVGSLARSSQPGKFVLVLGPGNSVTLDVDAVKGHQVIGGGVGQLLVQVDIDRAKIPETAQEAAKSAPNPFTGVHDVKHPILDKYPWEEPVKTSPEYDLGYLPREGAAGGEIRTGVTGVTGVYDLKQPFWDIKHPILDKPPWEEPVRTNPEYDLRPFALATPQQAPPAALSAMDAAAGSALRTISVYDITTGYRDHYKNPIFDATGRPPYLD
jgi:hypothetical protein